MNFLERFFQDLDRHWALAEQGRVRLPIIGSSPSSRSVQIFILSQRLMGSPISGLRLWTLRTSWSAN